MNNPLSEQCEANIADSFYRMQQRFSETEQERGMPHVLMRPSISIDGDMWMALYGENTQDGVAGFGKSPFEAMQAFDCAWYAKLTPTPPTT